MSEITLKNVSKIYGKKPGVVAVRELDLLIRDDEFLVLLGPSGCGKTSTLRMIAGLEEITAGDIYFDSRRVNDLPPGERNIAMAFESYALYQLLTVRENIAFPLRTRKMPPDRIKERVEWAAKTLHITDTLDKRPAELSGGQKQRVSLARAIVREPAAFLLDEPLSHLDMKQKQHMRAELKRLNADLKATMICVTHDQREAMALADRIAVMHDGVLQQIGTPSEIYTDPANEFVAGFIGEPPMNFIDCKIEERDNIAALLSPDGIKIAAIPDNKRRRFESITGKNIRVGIRPRQIVIDRKEGLPDSVPVIVLSFESIGEKGILTVKLGERSLKAITGPGECFEKDSTLRLTFPWNDLYFFSPNTGQQLRL